MVLIGALVGLRPDVTSRRAMAAPDRAAQSRRGRLYKPGRRRSKALVREHCRGETGRRAGTYDATVSWFGRLTATPAF